MTNRIRLGDDGTMDTVLVCTQCGQEARYNYSPSVLSDEDSANRRPGADESDYQAYVAECIEDFDSEHVCESDDSEE